MKPSGHKPKGDWKRIFRSLRHRKFRMFFMGQLASMIGTWLQIVAVSWLVYRLTSSAFLLGCVGFAMSFPALIVSPFAGIAADRFDRRKLLILVQALSLCQAAVLSVLFFSGTLKVWEIMVLSTVTGILNAFELTVRQAFLIDMVDDKNDLSNCIALNSSIFNASRLIGPAIAGVLIAAFSEGICFFLNAISFVPVIIALVMIRTPRHVSRENPKHAWHEFKEGVRYAFGFMPIRSLLLLLSILSLLMGVFQTLLPVFTKEVFKGGPQMLGFLLSASGIGALGGAILLAGRRTILGLGRHVALAGIGAGVAMLTFALMTNVYAAMAAGLLSGLGMIVGIGGTNIILQSIVDEDKRGRIMGLYAQGLMGMAPIGSILAGTIASRIGIVGTLSLFSVIALAAGVIFWMFLPQFRLHVRPIYVKKGLIPQA